jgi:receptor protein-tyrosine kinase
MQEQITLDNARHAPHQSTADGATTFALTHEVVVRSEPQSTTTESIHALRTLLTARHIHSGCRGVAICETEHAGGAFIAINLAMSLAEAGVRTLLVDTRLRDPELAKFVQPSRDVPGLGDVIERTDAPIAGAMHAIMPNLSLMYAGTARDNAQDLLSSQRFASIMDLCLREFDFTIATTAPANRFADARRVASVLKTAIVVARRNVTFVADVNTLISELIGDQVEVIGTVYNDF